MGVLGWVVLATLLGGLLSVAAAGIFLLLPLVLQQRFVQLGVSFAIGALLTAAFGHVLPHAFESAGVDAADRLFPVVLAGLLGFFVLEKFLLWRHCHAGDCEAHSDQPPTYDHSRHHSAGALILIGDSLHNFVDGVLIGAAFLTDVKLGVVTALAITAHEIPQEVGDFAILLSSGYGRTRALLYNGVSGLAMVFGGLLAYLALGAIREALPYFLAVAASSFIYVAVADLIPFLHRRTGARDAVEQVAMIAAGVALIHAVQVIAEGI